MLVQRRFLGGLFTVFVCLLWASGAWGAYFFDDFDRPDGIIGNGWTTQTDGTITVEIVGGEVLVSGTQGTDWVRAGINRTIVDETRVAFDFLANASFNAHIRVSDSVTGAFLEAYWYPGGPCQYASSLDGSWPGWTTIEGNNAVTAEYNHVVIDQDGTMLTITLNDVEIGTIENTGLGSITNLQIASDSAAGTTGNIHIDNVQIGTLVPGVARDPSPARGATDVRRDVTLGWTSAGDGYVHDVYFGTDIVEVDAATRTDSRGVLVSQGQTEPTYAMPDLLDFETTYYWRIDEVNTADMTINKGEVWSFVSEPFVYQITGIVATSNTTSEAGKGPERLVDGSGLDANDGHSTSTNDMWSGQPNPDEPSYVQFEFDNVYKLYEMFIWNYNMDFEIFLGIGVKNATIEYSQDGVQWTVFQEVELAQGPGTAGAPVSTILPLEGVAAQFVRLTIGSSFNASAPQYGLSEVRFTYVPVLPRDPQPADGATDVAVDTMLSWRPGREAVSHEIYLGTDPAAMTMVGTSTQSRYSPGILDLGAMYYWQVVEINEDEVPSAWAGNVWTFSTQEYIEVDGFETYDDNIETGTTVWQTWIDGIDDSTNGGGVVGYAQSPFGERTIVHSGVQSMPFSFENTSASAISEADRTFSPAQNWTVNGVKTLSLWFYGAADNAGQLYVKINGTKVLYEGDASDISKAAWQTWNIDLTGLGINVSNVTTLTIGVQGTGSGMIFVDDIRLYAKTAELVVPTEPDTANLVGRWAFDGDLTDGSGNGHNGTMVGAGITFENDATQGQVLSLPGGDDIYVSIGAVGISGTMPRTIACWAKADNTTIPDWTLIFGFTGTDTSEGGNGSHFNIGSLGGPGGVGAHCWGWEETIFSDTEALEWHHYAMSYDGTTIRYYGDGLPMDTDPAKSNVQDLSISGDRVHVGSRITQTSSFPGKVDDAVIYNVQLTDGQVAYLAGRTAPVYKAF